MAAFIYTYSTLLEKIPEYLERTDTKFLENIPVFIKNAQDRIGQDLKNIGLVTYLVGNFQAGLGVYQKPSKWLNTMSINFGSGEGNNTAKFLQLRTYEFCMEYHSNLTETGTPKYYADYGYDNWLIVPTPDANYPFEVAYSGSPPTLDESQQENWVTRFAPRLLLYAALKEAQVYLKNTQRVQEFEALYKEELNSLTLRNRERYTDRYEERNKD